MSESEKPKKKSAKQIIDVEKPGVSAPTPTSKPVIVTNRPLLQDPMVVAETDDKAGADSKDSEKVSKPASGTLSAGEKQVIAPLDQTLSEDAAETGKPDETSKPTENSKPDTASTVDESDDVPPAADTLKPEGEAPSPDTSKSGLAKQAEAEAVAQAKHDADVRQFVDSKQYVLPIKTVEQRKSRRFVLLGIGLAVILILIWLDIALDAGIIKLSGLKPLTHFFSN